jgi:ABC-type lipoprotein release transport system permease subunit
MQQITLKLRAQMTLMAMLMYLSSYLNKFNLFKMQLDQVRKRMRDIASLQKQIMDGSVTPEQLNEKIFDF